MEKSVIIPLNVPIAPLALALVDVHATITYFIDEDEGADADGNRGRRVHVIEDVSIERVMYDGEDVTFACKDGLADYLQDMTEELAENFL